MASWPAGAKEVLRELDGEPRARADLLLASGVDARDWNEAIDFLVDIGLARRSGTKRGTRYVAAPGGAGNAVVRDSGRPPQVGYVQPAVARPYHDIIEELFRELGHPDLALGGRSEIELWGPTPSAPAVAPPTRQVPRPGTPAFAYEDEDTDEVCQIVALLRSLGVAGLIDQREKNGCLWVIEGPGVPTAVKRVEKQLGVQFHFKPEGARTTEGRAAWWTKDG